MDTPMPVIDVTVRIPDVNTVNVPEVAFISQVPLAWPVKTALLRSTEGARSPITTPPVMFSTVQVLAATFAIKLSETSLDIAYNVIEDPEARDCEGITVPDPSAAVSNLTFVGKSGMTVNVLAFDNPPPPRLKTVSGN